MRQCRGCGLEVHIGCYGNEDYGGASEEQEQEDEKEWRGPRPNGGSKRNIEDRASLQSSKRARRPRMEEAIKKEDEAEDEEEEEEEEEEEDWWCEPCRAGAIAPTCCVCPNEGGAFKAASTEGWWIHAVCALYVPNVSWANASTMSPVYVHAISPERWGAKVSERLLQVRLLSLIHPPMIMLPCCRRARSAPIRTSPRLACARPATQGCAALPST